MSFSNADQRANENFNPNRKLTELSNRNLLQIRRHFLLQFYVNNLSVNTSRRAVGH